MKIQNRAGTGWVGLRRNEMANKNGMGDRIGYDERKEHNKERARRMVLVLGVACVILILAMIVEVYL